MNEYIVKLDFWLRAHDSFTVEADSDADVIEKAQGGGQDGDGIGPLSGALV
jgi:hypothetical protein